MTTSACDSNASQRSLPPAPLRSSRAHRLPRVTSGAIVGSSQFGGSIRSTSAPNPARNRVAIGFEFVGLPALHGGTYSFLVACGREDRERGLAMTRRIGVQPYPAVGAGVVAGNHIPDRRQRPADRLRRGVAPGGGQRA